MTTITRRLAMAGALVAGAASLAVFSPVSPASAAPVTPQAAYDWTDPIATGCATGAYTARSAYGKINGSNRILVELRYSPRCKTTWARITTLNAGPCVPGEDHCGRVWVHRNSDGLEIDCVTPGGSHGCYTLQVNDNGVTSYASGYADFGALTAYATTGSF